MSRKDQSYQPARHPDYRRLLRRQQEVEGEIDALYIVINGLRDRILELEEKLKALKKKLDDSQKQAAP